MTMFAKALPVKPLLTVALLIASPAFGSEVEMAAKYGPALENCYYNASDDAARGACVGLLDALCAIEEEVGEDPIGISMCLRAEESVWERLLAVEYELVSVALARADAAHGDDLPEMRRRVETLQAAQAAWRDFRAAECESRVAQYGGDLARGDSILRSRCNVAMTARRAIELRARLAPHGKPEMRP